MFATKPRTDLWMTCQQNISLFMQTQNCEDIDKKQYFATSGTFRFGAETTYGLSAEVILSKKAFREIVDLNLITTPIEISSVKANITFSFDFAQMVHYPDNSIKLAVCILRYLRNVHFLELQTKVWVRK